MGCPRGVEHGVSHTLVQVIPTVFELPLVVDRGCRGACPATSAHLLRAGGRFAATLGGLSGLFGDRDLLNRFGDSRSPVRIGRGFCCYCSSGWARTSDPSINSRMLCQLSYGGPVLGEAREFTLASDGVVIKSPAGYENEVSLTSFSCGFPPTSSGQPYSSRENPL
jgi:hypothetical protein